MGPVPLPDDISGHDNVQLLWRYYLVSGTAGTRPEMRLDDIFVSEDMELSTPGGMLFKEAGASLALSCDVMNAYGPLTLQWLHGPTAAMCEAIPGATQPILALSHVDDDDAGWYICDVTDAASRRRTLYFQLFVVDDLRVADHHVVALLIASFISIAAGFIRRNAF